MNRLKVTLWLNLGELMNIINFLHHQLNVGNVVLCIVLSPHTLVASLYILCWSCLILFDFFWLFYHLGAYLGVAVFKVTKALKRNPLFRERAEVLECC